MRLHHKGSLVYPDENIDRHIDKKGTSKTAPLHPMRDRAEVVMAREDR